VSLLRIYSIRTVSNFSLFLCAFAQLRKTTNSIVISVCPSAWNDSVHTGRIFVKFHKYFSKIFREKLSIIKIWQQRHVLYIETNIRLWSYRFHFFLEWEVFQINIVNRIKTYIFMLKFFFQKSFRLEDNVGKNTRFVQVTDDMAHAHCMLDT